MEPRWIARRRALCAASRASEQFISRTKGSLARSVAGATRDQSSVDSSYPIELGTGNRKHLVHFLIASFESATAAERALAGGSSSPLASNTNTLPGAASQLALSHSGGAEKVAATKAVDASLWSTIGAGGPRSERLGSGRKWSAS